MSTANKSLNIPGNNTYVNNWDIPMNTNFTGIDYALAGVCYILATGRSGTITMGASYSNTYPYTPNNVGTSVSPTTSGSPSYIPSNIIISGGYSSSMVFNVPLGIKGQWTVHNDGVPSGSQTISFGVAGGDSVIVPAGQRVFVVSDGVNMAYAQEPTITLGSTGLTLGSTVTTVYNLTINNLDVVNDLQIDGNALVKSPVYGWGGDFLPAGDGGVVDFGLSGSISNTSGSTILTNNAYFDGTSWRRKISGYSQVIVCNSDGSTNLQYSGTGAANSVITFSSAITMSNAGVVTMPVSSYTTTAPSGTNDTRIATTAFVQAAVSSQSMFTHSASYGSSERAAGVVYTNTHSTPMCIIYSTNLSDISSHYMIMKVNGNEAVIQQDSNGEGWVSGTILVPAGQTYQITREYDDTGWGSSRWVEVYTP